MISLFDVLFVKLNAYPELRQELACERLVAFGDESALIHERGIVLYGADDFIV